MRAALITAALSVAGLCACATERAPHAGPAAAMGAPDDPASDGAASERAAPKRRPGAVPAPPAPGREATPSRPGENPEADPYFLGDAAARAGKEAERATPDAPRASGAPRRATGTDASPPLPVDGDGPPSERPRPQAAMLGDSGPDAYVPDPAGILARINAYRARYGAGPLSYDPRLSAVARDQVRDLAARGTIAGTGRDGESLQSRIAAGGGAADAAGSLSRAATRTSPPRSPRGVTTRASARASSSRPRRASAWRCTRTAARPTATTSRRSWPRR